MTTTTFSAKQIANARAYLASVGIEAAEDTIHVPCHRCGDAGRLHCFNHIQGGICFACQGAKGHDVHIVVYARRHKARAANRKKAAEAQKARHEARIEKQRDWCEANGYGRITFEEKDEITKARREAELEAARSRSQHVGTPGKRDTFTAVLEAVHDWDGVFGTTWLFRFRDAAGNVLVCKTGTVPRDSEGRYMEKGQTVVFKATVKEHGAYKGEAQTSVQRLAIVEMTSEAVA